LKQLHTTLVEFLS